MPKKSPPKPRGRQTSFTQKAADEICESLSKGITLAEICRGDNMPAVRTVSNWKEANPDFKAAFARAREEGFDVIADSCLEIADDGRNDWIDRLDDDGEVVGRQLDHEHVQRSKLRIETRLKLLAKWNPKKYGEKLAIGGADDLPPLNALSDDDLKTKIALLMAKNGSAEQG